MSVRLRPSGSLFAAVVLTLLTLSVFALAQNQGPESAVLRYLEALDQGDAGALRQLTSQPIEDPRTVRFATQIQQLVRASDRIQIAGSDGSGREATVVAVFVGRRFGMVTVPFALVKPRNTWLVDAPRSEAQIQQMMMQGRG